MNTQKAWARQRGPATGTQEQELIHCQDTDLDISAETLAQKKRILAARAEALAREIQPMSTEEEALQVVEFSLAQGIYAFEATYVREVYQLKELTPLPCVPAFVRGIINVRGHILSVLDLSTLFSLPYEQASDRKAVVIIMRLDGIELGIQADTIRAVRFVSLSNIQASFPTLTGIQAEYLRGVTREHVVILDAEKILLDERIVVNEEEVKI